MALEYVLDKLEARKIEEAITSNSWALQYVPVKSLKCVRKR